MQKITDNSENFNFDSNSDYTFIKDWGGGIYVNNGDKSIIYMRDGGTVYKFDSINDFCSQWIAEHPMVRDVESKIKEIQKEYIDSVIKKKKESEEGYDGLRSLFGI